MNYRNLCFADQYSCLRAAFTKDFGLSYGTSGQPSVRGLNDLVTNLEEQLEINIGVLAAVPNRVNGTCDQDDIIEKIQSQGFDVPVVFRDRTSLLEGCWRKKCSTFTYVQKHRDRRRDYELETLAQFDQLARHLETQGDIDAPNPPKPGSLEHETDIEEVHV